MTLFSGKDLEGHTFFSVGTVAWIKLEVIIAVFPYFFLNALIYKSIKASTHIN